MRRGLLALLLGVIAATASVTPAAPVSAAPPRTAPAEASRPDIVLLMVDDLPQIDDRIWKRLPTIKRVFLDHGVRFTRYVGNDPLCCPGRANVLTGQWSHHHGVITNDARLFDPRQTIATELHRVGYWTGIFGKYFNRTLAIKDRTPPGWDRTFLISGAYYDYPALVDGRIVRFGHAPADHSTEQVRRRSLRALRAVADPDRPRFLWLAPFAVHAGWDERGVRSFTSVPAPRDRGAAACARIAPWVTPATTETDRTDKPAYVRAMQRRGAGSLVPRCESLRSVDRLLRDVLAELAAQGRPEPLVILTADNGMGWGAHGWYAKRAPYATPIPLFVSWPSELGTSARTISTTITNVDLAPTLCAIAGCVMGPFPDGGAVDGLDVLPVLLGTTQTTGREVIFAEHGTTGDHGEIVPWAGVRTTEEAPIGLWAYTEYVSGEKELYDLSGGPCWKWTPGMSGDPCELTNLAGDRRYATIQARLAATLAARERHPRAVLAAPD